MATKFSKSQLAMVVIYLDDEEQKKKKMWIHPSL